MAYHFGKTGYVGLSLQSSAATPETSLARFLPVKSMPSWKTKITRDYPKEYRGTLAEYTTFNTTKINSEGSLTVSAYPSGGLEEMVYGVLGSISTTHYGATDAYLHTCTPSQTLPIWTLGVGRDTLNYERFGDCQFGKMSIKMAPDSDIEITVDGNGGAGDLTQTVASPSYGTERALTWLDLAVSLGGSENCDVTSVDLTIDRGIKSVRTACSTAGYNDNVRYVTTTLVEGSIDMFFQDYTEYAYWLGASGATSPDEDADPSTMERALTITATGEEIVTGPPAYNDQLIITIPRIVYDDATIDMPWDERMKVKFNFKAMWDDAEAEGEELIKMQVLSKVSAVTSP